MKKEKRIKAYEYALLYIVKNPEEPFMCHGLNKYRGSYCNDEEIFNILPEFALFKDDNLPYAWLDINKNGIKTREIILEFCIEIAKTSKK